MDKILRELAQEVKTGFDKIFNQTGGLAGKITAIEPELKADSSVRLRVSAAAMSPVVVEELKAVLLNHPGNAPVYLHMTSESGVKILKLGQDHSVEPRSALFAELRGLFGSSAVF